MPLYDYKCTKCGLQFEEFQKLSERNDCPTNIPHDNCLELHDNDGKFSCKYVLAVNAPALVDPTKLARRKPDEGFRDRLREIKKSHRGSEINTF